VIAAKWLSGGILLLLSLALFFMSFVGFVSFVSGNEMEGLSNEGIGMFGILTFILAVPSAFTANVLMRSALADMRSHKANPRI